MDAAMGDDPVMRIRSLEAQVEHLKSLHERAEARLAHLLSFPNDVHLHRESLYRPEIAVPLLQCYDVEIAQLKDKLTMLTSENDELRLDNERLRSTLDRRVTDNVSMRVTDERVATQREEDVIRIKRLMGDVEKLQAEAMDSQRELVELRQQAAASHLITSKLKDEKSQVERRLTESEQLNKSLQSELEALTSQQHLAQKQLRSVKARDEEEAALVESQRAQIQLLTQENSDKAAELERLRTKLVHVLHQAGENHNTHMRIVEEKHTEALRVAREECRVHEITAAKLRAQLARVEHVNSGALISTTQAVESQARYAQDLELKRLYAELASAQLQRDDAVARLEHAAALHRTELDDRARELSRALEVTKSRLREVESRAERLEEELEHARDATGAARNELRAALTERSRLEKEKLEQSRALEEACRAKASAVAAREAAEMSASEQAERDKRILRSLERRLEDAHHEYAGAKDRFASEIEQLKRLCEELRGASRDANHRLEQATEALAEKERKIGSLTAQCDRLSQGLTQHKQQIGACDARLMAQSQQEETLTQQLRTQTLTIEQLRSEVGRMARERDRVAMEAQLLGQHLQVLAKRHGAKIPVAVSATLQVAT